MSLFQVDFEAVPPASQLGYVLYANGAALGPRTGAGILPVDWPDGVTAGLLGGDYSVLVDTVATGSDTIVWDTGGVSPQFVTKALVPPPLPVLASIAVTVPYTPNPLTAALEITEAGMDEGAYPCAVSGPAADGITYTLTASLTSLPAGLGPGDVSVQPGDIAGGVFTAATVGGIPVPPRLGTLSLSGSSAPLLDIAWSAGPVQTSVADPNSNLLAAGADGYLHILMTGTYNVDGTAADLGQLVDSGLALSVALVSRLSGSGPVFQPADVLTATAPPASAGTYARLLVSEAENNLPPPDCYYAAVQIGTAVVYAENTLIVWGDAPTSSFLDNSASVLDNSAGAGSEPGFDGGS